MTTAPCPICGKPVHDDWQHIHKEQAMSERQTPETDAAIMEDEFYCFEYVLPDKCRKLERERDALREELDELTWQCRDYADGWITFKTRAEAEQYQSETDAMMRCIKYYPKIKWPDKAPALKEAADE